jgi:hypothetical protein
MSEEDYCTRRINKINQILRKLGLKPRDQFESYIGDKCKLLTHWCLRNTFCYFSKDWIRNG